MRDEDKIAIKYAWNWFSFHANQRMVTFNFFLIIVGALGYKYLGLQNHSPIERYVICGIGIVISFAFVLLDRRNLELVNDGREALDELEKIINVKIRRKDEYRKSCCHCLMTHTFWFTAIELLIMLAFFVTGLLTYLKIL